MLLAFRCSDLELKHARYWQDAEQLTRKLLLLFVQILLAQPGETRTNLRHVPEVQLPSPVLHGAHGFVIHQRLQKCTRLVQRAPICFGRRVRQLIVGA